MISIAQPFLGVEEKEAVMRVLESVMLSKGIEVDRFESEFADYCGIKHGIATSNGTTALHTALMAHGVAEGDEVITSPFTFVATANAIAMVGAIPIFVDIEPDTYNIDPSKIEAAITGKTKAIIPVHLFGKSCDMDPIMEIARKNNLKIIEDACQAHGAFYQSNEEKKVGLFGTSCYSFYATKNITCGEGGMILTNDDDVARRARILINHGSESKYVHSQLGYNYRMTDISAAIGRQQLKKLNYFTQRRFKNAQEYNKGFQEIPGLVLPIISKGHVFHQYTTRILSDFGQSRDSLQVFLKKKGVYTSIFYPIPLHKQETFKKTNEINIERTSSLEISEQVSQEVLSFPVHPQVTLIQIKKIIELVKNFQRGNES